MCVCDWGEGQGVGPQNNTPAPPSAPPPSSTLLLAQTRSTCWPSGRRATRASGTTCAACLPSSSRCAAWVGAWGCRGRRFGLALAHALSEAVALCVEHMQPCHDSLALACRRHAQPCPLPSGSPFTRATHCHPSHACRWTQVSKQENQAHVVLATSDYSFTAWLAAGARGVVTLAPPFAMPCHAARTWKGW